MIKEIDNTPDSDWGIVTSKNLKVSEGKQRSWVVDNFYENPDQVRKYALGPMYLSAGHGGVGFGTRKQFIFDGVEETVECIRG